MLILCNFDIEFDVVNVQQCSITHQVSLVKESIRYWISIVKALSHN